MVDPFEGDGLFRRFGRHFSADDDEILHPDQRLFQRGQRVGQQLNHDPVFHHGRPSAETAGTLQGTVQHQETGSRHYIDITETHTSVQRS